MFQLKKHLLVLIRHGLSEWNQQNVFTGWHDPDIIAEGWEGARQAGKWLKAAAFHFDAIYESDLKRAQQTTDGVLEGLGLSRQQNHLPIIQAWEIKERDYGDLATKNKDEIREQYGEEQFLKWRRSYDVAPPNGESLKDTAARVLPYFQKEILLRVVKGGNVLVSAHGNSLRAMIMHLDTLSGEAIAKVEIPWTIPIIYLLDKLGNVTERAILGYSTALAEKFPYFQQRYQTIGQAA